MSFSTDSVSWTRSNNLVLNNVSIDTSSGNTIGLIGTNGSGKSSLLRLLAGFDRPTTGTVFLDDTPLDSVRKSAVAKQVAVVTQHAETSVDIPVRDIVALGRIPHRKVFGHAGGDDTQAISQALELTSLSHKSHCHWSELSGGERQRVHIARALAQEPTELLLDEPTNHLDVTHQLELLRLIKKLPSTSIIAIHDLNLAAAFCEELVVLQQGSVYATGTPHNVLTPKLLHDVFSVNALVHQHPVHGHPLIIFNP